MKIKTSIIILNWNTKELLKNCIDSVQKNTKYYEVIIVDNGSTDGSVDYLKSIEKNEYIKVVYNGKNLGYAKANNIGANLAAGKYLCFLNSDIIVGANWLDEMFRTFSKVKNCGGVGPLGNPDKKIKVQNYFIKYPQHKGQFKKDTLIETLAGFCYLVPKKIFFEVRSWDEDFEIGNFEDTFLSMKIKYIANKNLAVSVKSDVNHLHPSSTFITNKIDIMEYYEKNKKIFIKKLKQLGIFDKVKDKFSF